ncbi:purine permease 1-like [Malania oleifera]|uniref:purine permease 1-like n=1 Tax=Malania oleifera TaxID=397392 RepID=UPI0025ADA4CB|nr:purine permease 1-like [Malania oleifera]
MEIMETPNGRTAAKKPLLLLSCAMLALGNCCGPLVMRLYFLRGGNHIWLSSWLETADWPIILPALAVIFMQRRRAADGSSARFFLMKPRLFVASAVLGVLTGLDDYLYAYYGMARLPVSTSSLIIATQLAFTAGFAFLLVRQRFTSYSINAVVLLTIGAAILGIHASGDRPKNESNKEYYLGFFMTLAAAALNGLVLPVVELTYKKARQAITYSLVLEMQMVIAFFATLFCTIGMLVNHDFQAISREAKEFELGEARYYVVLVWNAILWQVLFLGAIGVIFCASSLSSGILISVLIPVTELLAIIFYKEKFEAEKGIALALSIWGFISYFYGEIKQSKKTNEQIPKIEMP